MTEFEFRAQVQASVQNFIESFMQQNNVSATMMEDAINKSMGWLKDQALKEMLISMQQAAQQAQQNTPEEAVAEDEESNE